MNGNGGDRLYNLLPAIYRVRDAAQGATLRALLGALEGEFQLLEDDLARLYDNWFIETCDEWVVPYLGDLLGVRGLLPVAGEVFSQRAYVANTLAYRRRKGTAAVLEQLARDVTGWPAKAVEFFERLITTQYLNHTRPGNLATVNLRDANQLELIHGPFERAAHTAEIRHIDNGRGRYNIPHVGIFLWRLQSYFVLRGAPRAASDPADGRYTFNPLGLDLPLFNRPRTETEITQLAAEENAPGPLRRRPLRAELEARRQALVAGGQPRPTYFGSQPVLQVFVQTTSNDPLRELQPEEIVICHLGDWRRPVSQTFTRPDGGQFTTRVAVDPALGRLAFPAGVTPHRVEVSYAYAFAGDLGGGPYNRRESVSGWRGAVGRPVTWQIGVTKDQAALNADQASGQNKLAPTLTQAVEQWALHAAGAPNPFGLITMMDSASYDEDLTGTNVIEIPAGAALAIVAADWPLEEMADPLAPKQRVTGRLTPDGRRPHLQGNVSARGTAMAASLDPGQLIIDGLLIEGALTVRVGNLGALRLAHTTLVPNAGGLTVNSSVQAGMRNERLNITLERCICGPLELAETVRALRIVDSIVDAAGNSQPAIVATATEVESSSILGQTRAQSLTASNSIFSARVNVARRQVGCVRFCYLPFDSLAPRRFRCQPKDAAAAGRIFPQFVSARYGDPGYGQLAGAGPAEISAGADDEGELGAFHFLQQTQRAQNLRASLDEYLRFGLEAGIFFVT